MTRLAETSLFEDRSWTPPTVVGNRLYARDLETIVAVDLTQAAEARPKSAPNRRPVAARVPEGFVTARSRLMAAHRTSDADALDAARRAFAPWTEDPPLAHLAHYYAGFGAIFSALDPDRGGAPALREAEDQLRAATDAHPDFADAHALLAYVYRLYYRIDPQRASIASPLGDEHLDKALRLEPENPRVLAIQGVDLVYTPERYGGDSERGAEILRSALDLYPEAEATEGERPRWGHAETWLWYSQALERNGDSEGSREAARRALEAAPDYAAARRRIQAESTSE